MAVQIVIKNSSAEDKRPTAPQLANGEIALNYNAAGSFLTCKDTDGNIQQVGGVKISEVAPESPVKQTLWFQPSSLKLFVYDGDSYLPIAGGDGGGGTPGGGITTIVGDFGIDASTTEGVATLIVDLAGGDDGLEFDVGRLKASIASDSQLGSVKIGDGIDIALDGTISVDIPQTLTFRGSVDLGQPPAGQINPDPPRTGDAYVASFGANPIDAGWTGIGGDVAVAGDLAVFDGTNWELINTGGTMQGVEGGAGIVSSTSGGIATVAVDAGAGLEFDADDKLIVSGYPDLSGGDLDERYLRLDDQAGDQTVASTGTTTFAGLTSHGGGIKATGAFTEGSITSGVFSDIASATDTYNFYAAGSAPNYFSGDVIQGDHADAESIQAGNVTGLLSRKGSLRISRTNASGASAAYITFDGDDVTKARIRRNTSGDVIAENINLTGLADARALTLTPIVDASTKVKALSPGNEGFLGADVSAVQADAVFGQENEEEVIGTLADYDGTVLETEVTEPPAEELEYTEDVETDGVTTQVVRIRTWTQTGTRPVYQGVDQTKLIPLLTKALQECLERIETLEALIN